MGLRRVKLTILVLASSLIMTALTSTVSACPPGDRAALLAFKSSLQEPYLGIFNSWTGTDCCTNWYGVSCDPTNSRVAGINLRGESEDPIFEKAGKTGYMSGSISPAICKLDRLTSLVIADWKGITGEIPACVTSLERLRILDLIGNHISGSIPADIGNLKRLTVFNVADNRISGEIPASFVGLTDLRHLDLSNNKITGTLPAKIGKLKMLTRALLGNNKISGSIPASIGKCYRLVDLDLSTNGISGSIPTQLGTMQALIMIDEVDNKETFYYHQLDFTAKFTLIYIENENSGLHGNCYVTAITAAYFLFLILPFKMDSQKSC